MDFKDLIPESAQSGSALTVLAVGILAGLNRMLTIFKRDRADGARADAEGARADAEEAKAIADAAIYKRLTEQLDFERNASASLTRTITEQNELLTKQNDQLHQQSELLREQAAQLKAQAGHIEQLTRRIAAMEREHALQLARMRTSLAKLGGDIHDFTNSRAGDL